MATEAALSASHLARAIETGAGLGTSLHQIELVFFHMTSDSTEKSKDIIGKKAKNKQTRWGDHAASTTNYAEPKNLWMSLI